MKKCSWCGKEYADTATLCSIDLRPLYDVAMKGNGEQRQERQRAPDLDFRASRTDSHCGIFLLPVRWQFARPPATDRCCPSLSKVSNGVQPHKGGRLAAGIYRRSRHEPIHLKGIRLVYEAKTGRSQRCGERTLDVWLGRVGDLRSGAVGISRACEGLSSR